MFIDGQTPNCASRHCRQLSPATRLPSCAENFFARSLVNSRVTLIHFSYQRSYICHPFNRRKRASSAARAPPPRQPCCAQNFLPNITQSLVISRVTLVPVNPFNRRKNVSKMLPICIPFETGTLPDNKATESWPSRLPLPNTQYAIRRPTCSFPLARACTTV